MNILIDIGHPGHVHLFRPFANQMIEKGHKILLTCREKEFEIELLEAAKFNYKSFGRKFSSITGKVFGLFKFDTQEFIEALKFKPDILLSHGSIYAAHAAFLIGKPHISFEDTFNYEQLRLYKPFTSTILTSDYPHPSVGKRNIQYSGYHELAYLHPNRFSPEQKAMEYLNLSVHDRFVIMRFVAWNATHDKGHKGLSIEAKRKAIKEFEKYAQVFISSESELPDDLKQYSLKIPAQIIHHVMYHADLIYGESATMITEGAVLGVPGIYLDNAGRLYTEELEKKYDLVYNFTESDEDQLKSIEKGVALLKNPDLKLDWKTKRRKMLDNKIDVTAFLVWFVENYPQSAKIMKENPDYQYRFK